MSFSDIMCKYKHIGTDMEIRPYMWSFWDSVINPENI